VESFGEVLKGELAGNDLLFDDGESGFWEDEGEGGFLSVREEEPVLRGGVSLRFCRGAKFFEPCNGPNKGFALEEGHVAGEEEDGAGAGAFEGGVDAAEWAAAGNEVAFNDADGEAGAFGFGADVLEEGAGTEGEAGFVAAHAGAKAAGEDADFQVEVES